MTSNSRLVRRDDGTRWQDGGWHYFPGKGRDSLLDLDMTVGAEEPQTGRLMFGIGVNSDAGLVGRITLDDEDFGDSDPIDEAVLPDDDQPRVLQLIETEVQWTLNKARGKMSRDPQGAIEILSMELRKVQNAPELAPDVRDRLTSWLQTGIREGERRLEAFYERRRRDLEQLAAARERELSTQSLLKNQEKTTRLMDRSASMSLMDLGGYRWADEWAPAEAARLIVGYDTDLPASGWNRGGDGDRDFVQRKRPQGSLFVELYKPFADRRNRVFGWSALVYRQPSFNNRPRSSATCSATLPA